MFHIQKDVEVPAHITREIGHRSKYPFRHMQVDDSFHHPKPVKSFAAYLSKIQKELRIGLIYWEDPHHGGVWVKRIK